MKKPFAFQRCELWLTAFFFSLLSGAAAQTDSLQNTFSLSYEHTHFDKQFANDWRLFSLEYKRQTGKVILLGRLNGASRFQQNGWQGEVEAYPVISKKLYGFAGVSYAGDAPVFARWRTGASLYYNLAHGWEAEGGFRFLYFNQSIWMGTAGVSKYLGPWLLNARAFFSLNNPSPNQSYFLKAQRFLHNEKDYLWLQVGSGISPDESRSVQLNPAAMLVSQRVNTGAKISLNKTVQLTLAASYARDEYRVKTFGNQFSGLAGVGLRF